jgi:hypothetical protein
VKLEQLAEAALSREGLLLRSLTQDFLRENPIMRECAKPQTKDSRILATAASLVELFATRSYQQSPAWTNDIGALPKPFHLLKSWECMTRLRVLCETESPEPLRKRGFYAPLFEFSRIYISSRTSS